MRSVLSSSGKSGSWRCEGCHSAQANGGSSSGSSSSDIAAAECQALRTAVQLESLMNKHLIIAAAVLRLSLMSGQACAESEGGGAPWVFHATPQTALGLRPTADVGSEQYPAPANNLGSRSSLAQLKPAPGSENSGGDRELVAAGSRARPRCLGRVRQLPGGWHAAPIRVIAPSSLQKAGCRSPSSAAPVPTRQ